MCYVCALKSDKTHKQRGDWRWGLSAAGERGAFCDYVTMRTDTLREAPVLHAGMIPIFCWLHLWVHCGGTWWVPIRCQHHGNTAKGESFRTPFSLMVWTQSPAEKIVAFSAENCCIWVVNETYSFRLSIVVAHIQLRLWCWHHGNSVEGELARPFFL